jgi:hypothetical protein
MRSYLMAALAAGLLSGVACFATGCGQASGGGAKMATTAEKMSATQADRMGMDSNLAGDRMADGKMADKMADGKMAGKMADGKMSAN